MDGEGEVDGPQPAFVMSTKSSGKRRFKSVKSSNNIVSLHVQSLIKDRSWSSRRIY